MKATSGNASALSTAERAALAVEALVWWVGDDPRVQRAYLAWRVAHGLLPGSLLDVAAMRGAIAEQPSDLPNLQRLVHNELRLDYSWLPKLLLMDFRATVIGERIGNPSLRYRVSPAIELPGRHAKNGGENILRCVEWFYRRDVRKGPHDSIRQMAKEYAIAAKRRTPARRNVSDGIRLAKDLLAIFEDSSI
jgi:hypothetical protein